ncbi:MAG: aminomethyl-transferring glycine dehydrogenase subunit GcvPA [Candidatus Diapherotrites archaeon]
MKLNFISNTEKEKKEMLEAIGINSTDELFKDIPKELFLKEELKLGEALSEQELISQINELSKKNANASEYAYFLGAGAYNHFIPAVVPHLAFRSEFYTAYTPYQPEISQGSLQAIYEWQTFISELTGMDLANASVYDGASAVADAMMMAKNYSKKKEVIIAKSLNPEYKKVVQTYAKANELIIHEINYENGLLSLTELKEKLNENTAIVIVQNPNFFGLIENLQEISDIAHEKNSLFAVAISEPISFGLLEGPGNYGADIVIGEGQSFGIPMSFGGPGVGFLATNMKYVRMVPGRLSGKTIDLDGKQGFLLTLQAREQHIRREKSISNICSNQALIALNATIYLSTLGKNGLKELANLNLQKAHYAAEKINALNGFELVFNSPFFNEFVIKTQDSKKVKEKLLEKKIIAGYELEQEFPEMKNCLLLTVTEMNSKKQIDEMINVLEGLQ